MFSMPGNNRRSSTAAENSPRSRKMALIFAASASETLNIGKACAARYAAGNAGLPRGERYTEIPSEIGPGDPRNSAAFSAAVYSC